MLDLQSQIARLRAVDGISSGVCLLVHAHERWTSNVALHLNGANLRLTSPSIIILIIIVIPSAVETKIRIKITITSCLFAYLRTIHVRLPYRGQDGACPSERSSRRRNRGSELDLISKNEVNESGMRPYALPCTTAALLECSNTVDYGYEYNHSDQ